MPVQYKLRKRKYKYTVLYSHLSAKIVNGGVATDNSKLQKSILTIIKTLCDKTDKDITPKQTINLALRKLCKKVPGTGCWLLTIDQTSGKASVIAHYGISKKALENLTSYEANKDIISMQSVVLSDPCANKDCTGNLPPPPRYLYLARFPIKSAGKVTGILGLTLNRQSIFTSSERETLDIFTRYLAVILEKAIIQQQKRENEATLTLINNLTRIITSSLNLNEVYEGFAEELRKTMDVDWASVVLIEGDKLRFYALSSKIDSVWRIGDVLPLAGTATEHIATTKKPLMEPDLAKERKFWTGKHHLERGIRSIAYLPLLAHGEVFGALIVASRRPHAYGERELSLLEHVTGQIALPIQNARLFEETEQKKKLLTSIVQITKTITSDVDFTKVFHTLIEKLRKLVHFDLASVTLVEGDKIRVLAVSPDTSAELQTGKTYPLKDSSTGQVLKKKKTIIQFDITEQNLPLVDTIEFRAGFRSSIHVPLFSKGNVFGSLNLCSYRPNAYGEKEKEILEQLANQIAGAIWSALLYAKAEQRARTDELTGLYNRRYFEECLEREIDRHSRYGGTLSLVILDLDSFKTYNDIHGHLAGDKVLNQIGQLIKRTVRKIDMPFRYGGDEFALLLPQTGADQAYIVAERVRKRISSRMWSKQLLFTASFGVATWPGDGATADELCSAADQALYYAKRTGGNRVQVAAKTLFTSTDGPSISGATAEKGILSIIHALAAAVEARDIYTHGHSQRVRDYAIALAEAIDLPPDRIANLSTAALLHDIGKIGIPDELLRKNDKMTAEQWEIVQSHTKLAAAIVGRIPSLTSCLPAILHHHERWDGNGYPTGLRGTAIPLEARILAIADAFEAMTAPRPYHQPLPLNKAIEELKRNSGTQFDPNLVEIFLNIIPKLSIETTKEKPETEEHLL